jgi:hypothetical protein
MMVERGHAASADEALANAHQPASEPECPVLDVSAFARLRHAFLQTLFELSIRVPPPFLQFSISNSQFSIFNSQFSVPVAPLSVAAGFPAPLPLLPPPNEKI